MILTKKDASKFEPAIVETSDKNESAFDAMVIDLNSGLYLAKVRTNDKGGFQMKAFAQEVLTRITAFKTANNKAWTNFTAEERAEKVNSRELTPQQAIQLIASRPALLDTASIGRLVNIAKTHYGLGLCSQTEMMALVALTAYKLALDAALPKGNIDLYDGAKTLLAVESETENVETAKSANA